MKWQFEKIQGKSIKQRNKWNRKKLLLDATHLDWRMVSMYKYRRRHLNYIQIFSWKIMWTFTLTQPVLMCLHFNGPPFPLKYKLNNWIHPMNIRCKRKILVKRNAIIELLRTLSHGSWCLQKDLISPFVDLFMLIFCWIWPFCVFGA